jgi:hypothetical protein
MRGKVWHTEVITSETEELLTTLGGNDYMQPFYLAGGTALALHLGHRRSADLDFFSPQSFNEDTLLSKVQFLPDFSLVGKDPQTLHSQVGGMKISFIGYAYPVLAPFSNLLGISVADPIDIACMKISAVASRGTRRDFVDLYTLAKTEGLRTLLERFERKFAQAHYNLVHVLKSLVYFTDAEKDPMPDMLVPLSWDDVKQFFTAEVPKIKTS